MNSQAGLFFRGQKSHKKFQNSSNSGSNLDILKNNINNGKHKREAFLKKNRSHKQSLKHSTMSKKNRDSKKIGREGSSKNKISEGTQLFNEEYGQSEYKFKEKNHRKKKHDSQRSLRRGSQNKQMKNLKSESLTFYNPVGREFPINKNHQRDSHKLASKSRGFEENKSNKFKKAGGGRPKGLSIQTSFEQENQVLKKLDINSKSYIIIY